METFGGLFRMLLGPEVLHENFLVDVTGFPIVDKEKKEYPHFLSFPSIRGEYVIATPDDESSKTGDGQAWWTRVRICRSIVFAD